MDTRAVNESFHNIRRGPCWYSCFVALVVDGFGKLVRMSAQLSVSEYCANFREFSLTTLIDTPLHVISTPCKILHLRERMCQYRHADRGQLQPNKESWEYYLNGSLRTFNVFVTTPQTTKMSLKVSQCLVRRKWVMTCIC